jgi:hypothetical protein
MAKSVTIATSLATELVTLPSAPLTTTVYPPSSPL